MMRRLLLLTTVLGISACSRDAARGMATPPGGTVDGGASAGSGGVGGAASGGAGAAAGTGAAAGAAGAASVGQPAGNGGRSGGSGAATAGMGGSSGSGSSGSSGSSGMACIGSSESDYLPPLLDKSCTDADDCFAGFHRADCCGSKVALAFNRSEQAAFEQYEMGCNVNVCMCPEQPPMAEDGSPLAPGANAIAECEAGTCVARAPDAGDCPGAMECVSTDGSCIPATGPIGSGVCRGAEGMCFYCDCTSPDTPVATPEGEKPIASLRVGDLVYSIDGAAIQAVPIARISRVAVFHHQVMRVRLSSGRTLEISPGHPTADGRLFGELREADELGGVSIVESTLVDYSRAFTHDILPASSTGTYFAAGVAIGSTLF